MPVTWGGGSVSSGGGSTAPGGSNGQVQFNSSGAFAGDAGLTYDAATDTLTSGGVRVATGSAGAPSIGSAASPTAGIYFVGSAVLFGAGATSRQAFNYNGDGEIAVPSGANFVWSATTAATGTPDLGLRRVSAGLVGVTSGGSDLGSLQAGNVTATALAEPVISGVTNEGTGGAVTYGYKVGAFLSDGTSVTSAQVVTATGNAVLDGTNYNRVTWGAVTNAAYYVLYRSVGGATYGPLLTTTLLTGDDTGLSGGNVAIPTTNTTGRVLAGDGSAAAPGIMVGTNGGLYSPTAFQLAFSTNDIPRFRILGGGAVATVWLPQDIASVQFGAGADATLSRAAAATLQLGGAPNATPIANTLIVGESGSGTNIPGGSGVISSGAGTGDATGSTLTFKTPTPGGSGEGAQTQVPTLRLNAADGVGAHATLYPLDATDQQSLGYNSILWMNLHLTRATLGSKSKTLTDATPTAFATIALADGGETGGKLIYRVVATDGGTARQVVSGSLNYAAVHVGATYAVDYDEVQQSTVVSSGTLTGAVTAAAASNLLTFSANFDTNLGTPVLTIYYRFDSTNAADVITPL